MIKKQNNTLSTDRYRITATLLNSWQRIFDTKNDVYESEEDTISYEDKVSIEMEKRKNEFINLLNRIPTPENIYMIKGRNFENKVCSGFDSEFSPIVENGAFQVTIQKDIDVSGVPLTLYGVLDVLKAGRIMDIKRVSRYSYGKYKTSHQHTMYMYLVPEAYDFTYLICDDNVDSENEEKRKSAYHYENYERQNCEDIIQTISNFISWLKANELFDTFIEKWKMKQN